MKYNLHTHTYLCKHAFGSAQEMVEQGLKDGYQIIGISDHIAYPTKNTAFRMEYEEKNSYLEDLKNLKIKYQDKITVLRGFEAEYQRELLYQLVDMFYNNQIDYLILGQHYRNIHKSNTYYGNRLSSRHIKNYVDQCIEAMKTGLFLFVAHPDLFMNSLEYFDENCYDESVRLIKAAIKYDVYLEYNAGGVRYGERLGLYQHEYSYPRLEFWELVKKFDAKVVINSDAHSPLQISDSAYKLACQQAYDLELNIVENIDLKEYNKRVNDFVIEYNKIREQSI
ncbi:histidinol-phosphatase [Erysipelotrichaceae bacterium OttesenSCG-928-M19]|nr:histidinol-phosphatase [Erysipelotrichaceae bacterium OttesenSCG-928-M19]